MESPGDEDTVEQQRAKLGRRAESPGSSPVLPALPDRRCLSCNGSVKLYCDTLLKIIMCSRDEVTLRKELTFDLQKELSPVSALAVPGPADSRAHPARAAVENTACLTKFAPQISDEQF